MNYITTSAVTRDTSSSCHFLFLSLPLLVTSSSCHLLFLTLPLLSALSSKTLTPPLHSLSPETRADTEGDMAGSIDHLFTDQELEALMGLRERSSTRAAGHLWMSQEAADIQNMLDLIAAACSLSELPTTQDLEYRLQVLTDKIQLLLLEQEEDEARFSENFDEARAGTSG
ncbi:unnamed protein product [Penicillium glandicola]